MFWDKYLRLCVEINKAPTAVAKQLGITSAAVNGWRNGGKPQERNIMKLCDYFGVPHNYFDEKENPVPDNQDGADPLDQELNSLLPLLTQDQKKLLLSNMRFLLSDEKE